MSAGSENVVYWYTPSQMANFNRENEWTWCENPMELGNIGNIPWTKAHKVSICWRLIFLPSPGPLHPLHHRKKSDKRHRLFWLQCLLRQETCDSLSGLVKKTIEIVLLLKAALNNIQCLKMPEDTGPRARLHPLNYISSLCWGAGHAHSWGILTWQTSEMTHAEVHYLLLVEDGIYDSTVFNII